MGATIWQLSGRPISLRISGVLISEPRFTQQVPRPLAAAENIK
jgi:hypothetical protein